MVGIHGGNEGFAGFALCGVITGEGRHCEGRSGRDRAGGLAPGEIGLSRISDFKNESDEPKDSESRRRRRSVPGDSGRVRSEQVRSGQRRVMALVAVSCSLREMGSLSVTTPHLPKAGPTPCPATVSESQSEANQKPARARRFPPLRLISGGHSLTSRPLTTQLRRLLRSFGAGEVMSASLLRT